MRARTVISLTLSMFIVLSIGYLVITETAGTGGVKKGRETGEKREPVSPNNGTHVRPDFKATPSDSGNARALTDTGVTTPAISSGGSSEGQDPANGVKATRKDTATRAQDTNNPISIGQELPDQKVRVYYFHGTMRCKTCRTIEAYSKEAVETAFAQALKDRRLEWRVLNIEQPENEHFVQDFQLTTRSLVLEQVVNGKCARWKNLERVWDLVGEKDSFRQYVREEIASFLDNK